MGIVFVQHLPPAPPDAALLGDAIEILRGGALEMEPSRSSGTGRLMCLKLFLPLQNCPLSTEVFTGGSQRRERHMQMQMHLSTSCSLPACQHNPVDSYRTGGRLNCLLVQHDNELWSGNGLLRGTHPRACFHVCCSLSVLNSRFPLR